MKLFCLGIIVFSVLVIVLGIITVHNLPGKVARKRGHPQVEAIHICSLLGLIIFPFWMVALLWAYIVPVLKPIELQGVSAVPLPQPDDGGQG